MSTPKASAFAELLQTSLSSRTVYVRCIPAPVNFYERRAMLRVIQKITHETVETFKKLEDNSSFVVVTTKPGTATALVNDSPFQRVILSQDSNAYPAPTNTSWGGEYDLRGSIATPIDPLPLSKVARATPALSDLGISYKTFTLHMFAANRTYNHRDAITKNPLHGPWPPNDSDETFVSAALRRIIPSGAMAPALRDWHTANQLSRDNTSFAEERMEGAAAVLLKKKRLAPKEIFYLERLRARQKEQEIPAVMKSLIAFADGKIHDASPLDAFSNSRMSNNTSDNTLTNDSSEPSVKNGATENSSISDPEESSADLKS